MICWPQLEHCQVPPVCGLDLRCHTPKEHSPKSSRPVRRLTNRTFQGQHFSGFSRLLRHLTVGFYLSCVRPGGRGREVRPPALTYVSELQERESEKALRINLQLLQLSRHTLLYLFNHTCLWTINNFNRAHKCSAPLDPAIQRTVTNPGAYIYVRGLSSSLGKKL